MKKVLSILSTVIISTQLLPVTLVLSLVMMAANIEENIKNENIGRWDLNFSVETLFKNDPPPMGPMAPIDREMRYPPSDGQNYNYEVDKVEERIRLFEEKKRELLGPDRPNLLDRKF